MSNLSTRAFTGDGEDTLIGGTTITGNRPRQIAVRCSSDELLAPYGIGTAVGFPRVRMYASDGTELARVDHQRVEEVQARYSGLTDPGATTRDTLAIVTLYPGQYTFHVFDNTGHIGVVIFELYDLSFAPEPFP
jgi:hypothetical protein